MLPSTQNAGFSAAGPVAALVTVTTQMSRPSWLLPIDSTPTRSRMLARERVQEVGELGVAVEAVEGDGGHAALDGRLGLRILAAFGQRSRPPSALPDTVIFIRYTGRPCCPPYAELHCLSNFSFLRGASHPEELVERAQALGYAALALTDECSVAGVVRAHLAAKERQAAAYRSAASSR